MPWLTVPSGEASGSPITVGEMHRTTRRPPGERRGEIFHSAHGLLGGEAPFMAMARLSPEVMDSRENGFATNC